jgi:hypothetical protein
MPLYDGLHDVVKFLIVEHLQDVNTRGLFDKETPLHVASFRGHANIARLLLEHGADKDAQDHDIRKREGLLWHAYYDLMALLSTIKPDFAKPGCAWVKPTLPMNLT